MAFGIFFLLQFCLITAKILNVEPLGTTSWLVILLPSWGIGGLYLVFMLAFALMCWIVRR